MPNYSKRSNCHCLEEVKSLKKSKSEYSAASIGLSTDILTEVLTFLTRPQLDTIIFTCRHIFQIIESRLSSAPYRFLEDVYLGLYSQKFFFEYLAASAQESAEGWYKTRYSNWLTLDWKNARREPIQQRKVFGDYCYGKNYLMSKAIKSSSVHISFTPSNSRQAWTQNVEELVDQILELRHLWKDAGLFLSFNHFDSSKLKGSENLLKALFGRMDEKNRPSSIQLDLSDRNKGAEIKMNIKEYDLLRACQTIQLNLTNECFNVDSVVEYLHGGKIESQTMKLYLTNEAATRLIDILKQRFLAADTCCAYQLSIHCITTNYNGMISNIMVSEDTKERLEMCRDSDSLYCPPYKIRRYSS